MKELKLEVEELEERIAPGLVFVYNAHMPNGPVVQHPAGDLPDITKVTGGGTIVALR